MANKKKASAAIRKGANPASKKKAKKKSAAKPSVSPKPASEKPGPAARRFEKILAKLSGEEREVQAGRMMSSRGIVRKGKVFAFLWNEDMVFRLGKGFDPAGLKVESWSYLNPFKDRPPMKGWFVIPPEGMARWERLARAALETMRAEQEK